MKDTLLMNASRDELIEELKSRESITHVQVNNDDGAVVTTTSGRLSILGKSHIFVINENEKVSTNE